MRKSILTALMSFFWLISFAETTKTPLTLGEEGATGGWKYKTITDAKEKIKEGDKVVIDFGTATSGSYAISNEEGTKIVTGEGTATGSYNSEHEFYSFSGTSTISINVNNAIYEAIQTGGMRVEYDNSTCTAREAYISVYTYEDIPDLTEIRLSAPTAINDSWNYCIVEGASYLLNADDNLVLSFDNASGTEQFAICDSEGNKIFGGNIKNASYDSQWKCYTVGSGAKAIQFAVDADLLAKIQNNGMRIEYSGLENAAIKVGTIEEGGDEGGDEGNGTITENGWEGSVTFADWNTEPVFIAAELFTGLAAGDKVVFTGTVSGEAEIQIAYNDPALPEGKQWTDIVSYDLFDGTYTIVIDETNLSQFTNGIFVKGHDYTLTNVKVVKAGEGGDEGGDEGGEVILPSTKTNIWSGEETISWSGNGIKLLGYWFQDAKVGDILQFTFKDPITTGKEPDEIQIGNSSYKAIVESAPGKGCVSITKETYELELTEDYIDQILNGEQDGGLRLKGRGTLLSIDLYSQEALPSYTTSTLISYETPHDMGRWSDDAMIKILAPKFKGLKEGDKIVINLANAGDETTTAQLQIATASGKWSYLRPEFQNVGVQAPKFFFTIGADETTFYPTNGMAIKGQLCSITSIEIWKKGTSTGINEINGEAGSAESATVIYDLNGRRMQDTGSKGVYIICKNGKTRKVIVR